MAVGGIYAGTAATIVAVYLALARKGPRVTTS